MHRITVAYVLGVVLVTQPVPGAERDIRADWTGFRQQVSARNLSQRSVRVTLSAGNNIKATLVRVEDGGLVVKRTASLAQWATESGEALIPRDHVRAVRFLGRSGKRGLVVGLAGVGVGVAIPVGIGASNGTEGVYSGLVAVFLAPLFGLAGYVIGHFADRPGPQFIIE